MFSLNARKVKYSICIIYLIVNIIFALRIRQDMTKRRKTKDNIRLSNGPKNKFGIYAFNLSRWSSLRKYVFCFKYIFVYLSDMNYMHWQLTHSSKKEKKKSTITANIQHQFYENCSQHNTCFFNFTFAFSLWKKYLLSFSE